jgi:BASS family bile acid:Na+ symporter
MDRRERLLDRLGQFIHTQFLWLIACSYAVAACYPSLGLWMRDVVVGEVSLGGAHTTISLSMLMLAFLLLNAGLGVDLRKIRETLCVMHLLGAGLAANLLIPIGFIFLVTSVMSGWHNADEVQNILVGLALVASMPIAGSSTAWVQNADGELALSLGLVLASTLLSPVTTPLALHAVGLMASGQYANDLHGLAAGGTAIVLTVYVLSPSLVGIGLRQCVGNPWYTAARPRLKLINAFILLVLNYSNACVSLPQVVANPDLDFLGATLLIVVCMCAVAFAAGWSISRLLNATSNRQTSLMFSLGMNNNGTGLVLASTALAGHPRVMLPIIFYNLTQHLVAGIVDRLIRRAPATSNLMTSPRECTNLPHRFDADARFRDALHPMRAPTPSEARLPGCESALLGRWVESDQRGIAGRI